MSGIVAAIVLGISRAIGETMIVTIAAGSGRTVNWNPLEAMMTMTAYIAQAGSGDVPVGTIDYKTIFAVGSLLFLITFVLNAVQHPHGPPVPGGVRVTATADAGTRAVPASAAHGSADRPVAETVFKAGAAGLPASSRFAFLATLIVYVVVQGLAAAGQPAVDEDATRAQAGDGRRAVGHHRARSG